MTFSINIMAGTKSLALSPADTNKNAILTGSGNFGTTLLSLQAISTSGTPTLDLWFYDSDQTKEAKLVERKTLATNSVTTVDLSGLTLESGDELRAQGGTTAMDIILTYAVRGGGSGS